MLFFCRAPLQDFLNAFTRAVIQHAAPEATEDRISAAFEANYTALTSNGVVPKALDVRLEFRHLCKWVHGVSAPRAGRSAQGRASSDPANASRIRCWD
jgi:hypothetical protein